MFDVDYKKSYFSKQFVKLTIKICLILRVGPTGTWNQDLRPFSNSFQCYESNVGIKIGKRASIENYIFRGKPYYLDLREISVT